MRKYIFYKGDYPYVEFDSGCNFHRNPILWVSKSLIEKDDEGREFVEVTGNNRRIVKTNKGNFVLKQGSEEDKVFYIETTCGYRGSASYEIKEGEGIVELPLLKCHSPRGNLGEKKEALIYTRSPYIIYKETRTGRLYGDEPVRFWKVFTNEQGEEVREQIPPCLEDNELCSLLDD